MRKTAERLTIKYRQFSGSKYAKKVRSSNSLSGIRPWPSTFFSTFRTLPCQNAATDLLGANRTNPTVHR